MTPNLGDIGRVELVASLGGNALFRGVAQDVETLRVRLHQSVLDPVVNHLHKVAGAARAAIEIATLRLGAAVLAAGRLRQAIVARRQRREDRVEPFGLFARTANHEAVATLEPPHSTAGADVEKMDAALRQRGSPPNIILVERV